MPRERQVPRLSSLPCPRSSCLPPRVFSLSARLQTIVRGVCLLLALSLPSHAATLQDQWLGDMQMCGSTPCLNITQAAATGPLTGFWTLNDALLQSFQSCACTPCLTVALDSSGITYSPIVIGGSSPTSTLQLRATSGVGTTGADVLVQSGTNGATEIARFLDAGNVGIGTATPNYASETGIVLTVDGKTGTNNPGVLELATESTTNTATAGRIDFSSTVSSVHRLAL